MYFTHFLYICPNLTYELMKKIILPIAILGLVSLSCKKDYSCTCTYTSTYDGTTETEIEVFTIEEASKSQARAACNEATLEEISDGDKYTRKCSLSK